MIQSTEVTRRQPLETALNIIGLIASLMIAVVISWIAAGVLPTELEGH